MNREAVAALAELVGAAAVMPRVPRRSGLSALACLACGQAPDTATVSIAGSAAVHIVTNVPGSIDAADGWSLAAAPRSRSEAAPVRRSRSSRSRRFGRSPVDACRSARTARRRSSSSQTPEGFEPHEVREGRVWGVFRDELDVESVRAYDIVRP